ncbi:MAG: bacillithiol biosynthesis deacetylase BshB1 [Bacteroidota bacterium]
MNGIMDSKVAAASSANINVSENSADVLAIGAHPDDVEISAGGSVAKLVREGKRVVIVDCTRGEQSTRGMVSERMAEACEAAEILGVHKREVLELPDGFVGTHPDHVLSVIKMFRKYRPRIVLMPPPFERHPDHEAVHRLCRSAYFLSGLAKIETMDGDELQKPFRPMFMFCYIQAYHHEADFFVDVSETYQTKLDSIRAFRSQVHIPDATARPEPQTFISSPAFMDLIENRSRLFGSMIGCMHAEGFLKVEPLRIESFSHWL